MHRAAESAAEWDTASDVPWTVLELDDLVDAYWEVVAPELEADGIDPQNEKPTHNWLTEQGLRSLLYTLREHHNRTFSEFWEEDLGLETPDEGFEWATTDERTIEALESFLTSRRSRKGLAASSIDTLRYRLNRFIRAYKEENGTADIVSPVAREGDVPAHVAVDNCFSAFDRLHRELEGNQTKQRIHLAVSNWYSHLVRRKWATFNPVEGLDEEYDWSKSDSENDDTPCLTAAHVQSLYETATDIEEQLLVVALCGWGLRPNEVAKLRTEMFVFDVPDGETPYIQFEERKNGPGQVSILFGQELINAYIDSWDGSDDWSEYLFPSPHSSRAHITRWTVWNRFQDLAERAGLPAEIAGESTSAKMGRRFWYDIYSSALDVILDGLEGVAADQGSESPEVVLRNYLSEARIRDLRREYMRAQLADAFSD
ncbi:tyrosine-type recombinase/integrase [Natrarchaeobaculum sulfurireducens]|uniref:XerD/XerC family integrase n=1 Tax=Natrarchaeobaculum sulfurireducens TaxID=2044521 RepID=A0A346PK40_9EURY|nr:site-specific integrase [Natrarchaeobaculum sulfurireducens]AXR79885.1 XerD/XerC family integrase [Natrarchaeobaculum sulfurireducens]